MKSTLSLLLLAVFVLAGCTTPADPTPQTGRFTLKLDHVVGFTPGAGTPLVLNTPYKNENGDDFTVSALKYYLSNVQLTNSDGSVVYYCAPGRYFLVDHADPASQLLQFDNVPLGGYFSLSFTVGVDSARVKAGSFTGVLDASHGMYRTATQDFVNFRFAGTSPQSPTGRLAFDVAGYRGTSKTLRTAKIILVIPYSRTNAAMHIQANTMPQVHVYANIEQLFSGSYPGAVPFQSPLSFALVSSFSGGAEAVKMADKLVEGPASVFHMWYFESN